MILAPDTYIIFAGGYAVCLDGYTMPTGKI